MRQSLLILILFFSVFGSVGAAEKTIDVIYNDYSRQKKEFLNGELNRQNIKIKLGSYLKNLNASLNEIQDIEKNNKKILLSPEGNQLALDLEVIGPVQILVQTKFLEEDCQLARHANALNSGDAGILNDSVKNIIEALCR